MGEKTSWRTLCVVRDKGRMLLGLKKRGFGAGRWNGFGGKLKARESLREAARQEVGEECGLAVFGLELRGRLTFSFLNSNEPLTVFVFAARGWSGEPRETDEMRPRWVAEDAIPYERMWPDDRYWLPLFLAGKCFTGSFTFADADGLVEWEVKECHPADIAQHISEYEEDVER